MGDTFPVLVSQTSQQSKLNLIIPAQSGGAVEHTDCISA